MSKYVVLVDYVTTARVMVEADDAESAEQAAWDYVHTDEGFERYMAEAEKNVKFDEKRMLFGIDGFDIPINAYEYSGRERKPEEIIDLTKERASNERCPVCGSRNIEGDSATFFPGGVIQLVGCRDCLSDWTEVYKFDKHEEVHDATKEE